MHPALIFDFGNVVAYFDFNKAAEKLGAGVGLSGSALLAKVLELGFDALLKRYESGKITSAEFSAEVLALIEHEMDHDQFAQAWADIFRLNRPVAELIAGLKQAGHSLLLGSNTNEMHAVHFRRQFAETLAHFDRLVLSYEVGHIKPSGEFYKACAAAAGRPESECVFIDDLPENIEGARAAGLIGIVYRGDTAELIAELAKLGVSPV